MSTETQPTSTPVAAPAADLGAQLAGKYMTFQLANEIYGLEILKVREIIGLMDITRVPRSADFIRGVINLRGKVIPVADLRLKFGMEPCQATEQTVIIVVQCAVSGRNLTMGILVDQVLEVLSIEGAQIEPPPSLGEAAVEAQFILGVGKAGDRVIFLLDIGKVLGGDAPAAAPAVA
ncbi:MAG TPA: chemotaxis protein CheW [Anaeromyxobacteraceae bacterium]|nr:chemotaxis protein CheW [Anaeromyxobacteraceae bacterium]